MLHVLAMDVGVRGIFSDWPGDHLLRELYDAAGRAELNILAAQKRFDFVHALTCVLLTKINQPTDVPRFEVHHA